MGMSHRIHAKLLHSPLWMQKYLNMPVISGSATPTVDPSTMGSTEKGLANDKFHLCNLLQTYFQISYYLCYTPFKVVAAGARENCSKQNYQVRTHFPQKVFN